MKLIWSPETASKAYIETVKSCEKFKESGVAELLSAMAAGWNAKLIVEAWSHDGPIATSVGLAIAARATGGRHVCVVPDERSRLEYAAAMRNAASSSAIPEIAVGEAETAMAGLVGVDFLVVDCKRRDFARVLRLAKVCHRGAVFACKNAWQRNVSGFRWQWALERGTRVVRSVFLPVGKGLDIAHIGSNSGTSTMGLKKGPSRWIKHVDQRSGEEHVFRK
ncbi:hypothetical protein FNV43_RR18268 [Rhamnella rubrinervis]|uniref:S-adenosyl-L-methionine-dependent methyltransferase n=1 Tax=Rhamnella rubrinervis TaxID=2594499 RepID=A0A8K0GY13_9ROSA|nr:hypothetical protein FNV43_RR18268 [Rhamnella rubrinervis]